MNVQTNYQYIIKTSKDGEPCLIGGRIPLTAIITEFDSGSSLTPEHIDEFLRVYPLGIVTASMIYEAFVYYHDNKAEVDRLLTQHNTPPKGFVKDSQGNYFVKSDR